MKLHPFPREHEHGSWQLRKGNKSQVPWPQHPDPTGLKGTMVIPWADLLYLCRKNSHRCLGQRCVWAIVSSGCNYFWPSFSVPQDYSVPLGHPSMLGYPLLSKGKAQMLHHLTTVALNTNSTLKSPTELVNHIDTRAHQNRFRFCSDSLGLTGNGGSKHGYFFLKVTKWF